MIRILKKYIITILNLLFFIKLSLIRFLEVLGGFFPETSLGCKIRGCIYRPFLKNCGANFQVALNVKFENLNKINIGNNVYVGYGSWINGHKDGVTLCDEVMLGPYVTLVANNHSFLDNSYRFGKGSGGEIKIGSGTWLAAKSTVTAGVVIGKGVLVGANSVVTKDIKDNFVVGGVPAKMIRIIER
ncbi:acyltransferase [Halosquirtibacter xylanolyticus]|uniref:acyltransferase n=1 Tax=Halosquirtibacter xylanolyticus TaxID=3374599 RepID=UPI003749FCD5|nr:acyltransferase [Prolixibacteraceae bacterium]